MSCTSTSKSSLNTEVFDEKYLLENAVLASSAWSANSSQEPDIICNDFVPDENELIKKAHLAASEKDARKLDAGARNEDDTAYDVGGSNASTLDSEECSPRCDDIRELEEKFNMLYSQKHADETDLIQRAKLADDELHAGMANQQEVKDTWNKLKLPVDVDDGDDGGELNGYKTPVNSEIGGLHAEAEVAVHDEAEADEKLSQQMTSVDQCPHVVSECVHVTVVTDFTEYENGDPDFSRLLSEIVRKLGDCSMDDILSLFSGSFLLETGLFTGLVTPEQMMVVLQRFHFVSRDNVRHVQTLVRSLDDTDLYTRAVQYIRHHHHTIHFYPELETLPSGFGLVRCQVSGRDFTRFAREDLELVRFNVTSVLFLPPGDAYIVGIEPGRSVLVSCMLPERYVIELADMASRGLPELKRAGIDALQIHGKTYLTGYSARPYRDDQEHVRFLSVFKQLREKSGRLEERDREVDQLRQEVTFMQLELDTMGAELELLTQKAVRESFSRQVVRVQQRQERRPHRRTRSLPLSSAEPVGRLEIGTTKPKPSPLLPVSFKSTNTTMPRSEVRLLKALEGGASSSGICARRGDVLSRDMRKQFGETNTLMGEIQDILGELGTM